MVGQGRPANRTGAQAPRAVGRARRLPSGQSGRSQVSSGTEEGAVDAPDAEEDQDDVDEYNRIQGAMAKAVLEYLARNIVDDPDGVVIELEEGRRGDIRLSVHVAPEDMGKVIGRRGRVAQAIRTVVKAAGAREGVGVNVDIVD